MYDALGFHGSFSGSTRASYYYQCIYVAYQQVSCSESSQCSIEVYGLVLWGSGGSVKLRLRLRGSGFGESLGVKRL